MVEVGSVWIETLGHGSRSLLRVYMVSVAWWVYVDYYDEGRRRVDGDHSVVAPVVWQTRLDHGELEPASEFVWTLAVLKGRWDGGC